jgi:hypothetical protein
MHNLYNRQKQDWKRLQKATGELKNTIYKKVNLADTYAIIQYNSGRARFSRTKVDPASIAERRCFLCKENLSPEQTHIPWNNYIILCNPAPVFPFHFTIPGKDHTPQQIQMSFPSLLHLTRETAPDFICMYNGPGAGASAPDHHHFQIIPRASLAIEKYLGPVMQSDDRGYSFHTIDHRKIIIIKNSNLNSLINDFAAIYHALSTVPIYSGTGPLLNILSLYKNRTWLTALFPRATHRPRCYYEEGDNALFVSPGAIDIGGVIITTRMKDFERLDKKRIETIYKEVSLSAPDFKKLIVQ